MNIHRNDSVIVISGKDKGKRGKVNVAIPKTHKVIVEGVAVATVHRKPRGQGMPGGIIHREAAIDVSNVMLVCSKCSKATRVGTAKLEDGKKLRVCKKCGATFDS